MEKKQANRQYIPPRMMKDLNRSKKETTSWKNVQTLNSHITDYFKALCLHFKHHPVNPNTENKS